MLARRRSRVQRLAAKRPPDLLVTAAHSPRPGVRDRLLDLLLELLDERRRSGRG
jgi:hypothetical protein